MERIPEDIYKTIIHHVPIVCVDLAIIRNGRIMLVKRNDPPAKGEWWVPGGRVLKGESLKDAAKRKAKEETGLDVWVSGKVYTEETVFPDGPFGESVHSVNIVFTCHPEAYDQIAAIDPTSEAFIWTKVILSSYSKYVQNIMRAIGFTESRLDHLSEAELGMPKKEASCH